MGLFFCIVLQGVALELYNSIQWYMKYAMCLFHMNLHRLAGYSDADYKIRSPWILRHEF